MKKLITLFALSALSAAVLAEGETPTTAPVTAYTPYAMTEAQQAMIAEQQQAMTQAFEAQRQFIEQQQKAMQEAFEEQHRQFIDQAHTYGAPDIAAFPTAFPEPPAMPTPFAETNPMMDLPQPPSYTELRTLSPENRRAAMKEYAEQRRAAVDKYQAEVRKQIDAEWEAAVRNARAYM